MKLKLLLMTLLLSPLLSQADTTLVFKLPASQKTENLLTYYISHGRLRYEEASNKRINLFDQKTQEFTSLDQVTGTISRINHDIINQHVEKLNQQRLEKLKTVEAGLREKLKSMDTSKKEAAEVIMNKLKYPEFYGDHTFLASQKTTTTKTINNIECRIYNINQNDRLVRQLCMALPSALKMNDTDYQTLRSFLKFNYDVQSKLALAAGQSSFTYIDYDQHKIHGIPLEITLFTEKGSLQDQVLTDIHHKSLNKALFEIKPPVK